MKLNKEKMEEFFMMQDELSIKDNILRTALDNVFIADMLDQYSP